MYCLRVTYPKAEGTRFDFEYYRTKHMEVCAETLKTLGFKGYIIQGPSGAAPGGEDATWASVDIVFDSLESLQSALPHTGPMADDVKNYTDCQPQMSFCSIELGL